MKREFVTSVFMYCKQSQYEEDILSKISAMDRTADIDRLDRDCPVLGALKSGTITNCVERSLAAEGEYYVEPYNPALFLALAAMSSGPDLFPGEYVIIGFGSKLLKVIRKDSGELYVLSGGDQEHGFYFLSRDKLSRVSKEDLINHFTSEPDRQKGEEGFNPDIGVDKDGKFVNAGISQIPNFEKPPLGIVPRKLHEESRIREVMHAIERRLSSGQNIPEEWQDELNCLLYDRIERTTEA